MFAHLFQKWGGLEGWVPAVLLSFLIVIVVVLLVVFNFFFLLFWSFPLFLFLVFCSYTSSLYCVLRVLIVSEDVRCLLVHSSVTIHDRHWIKDVSPGRIIT